MKKIFSENAQLKKAHEAAEKITNLVQAFLDPVDFLTPLENIILGEGLFLHLVPIDETHGVSGFYDPEQQQIYVNKNEPMEEQRFTAAHELGHYILGHTPDQYDVLMKGQLMYSPTEKPLEAEANHFAAHLLVPHKRLLLAMKHTTDADTLAELFGVPRAVLQYCLMQKTQ
jgi:Zn-dependent peptidase ImmA (M78 family)